MNKAKFFAVALASAMALTSATAMAAGDAAKGAKVFKKCKACHSIKAGKKKVGPSMFGVVGRKAGTAKGYRFSKAMKSSGLTWDEATLDKFVSADPYPHAYVGPDLFTNCGQDLKRKSHSIRFLAPELVRASVSRW